MTMRRLGWLLVIPALVIGAYFVAEYIWAHKSPPGPPLPVSKAGQLEGRDGTETVLSGKLILRETDPLPFQLALVLSDSSIVLLQSCHLDPEMELGRNNGANKLADLIGSEVSITGIFTLRKPRDCDFPDSFRSCSGKCLGYLVDIAYAGRAAE